MKGAETMANLNCFGSSICSAPSSATDIILPAIAALAFAVSSILAHYEDRNFSVSLHTTFSVTESAVQPELSSHAIPAAR